MSENIDFYDVIVIGGGPAGMIAALSAREKARSLKIILLDSNMKLGRKLSVTGHGRCNITNSRITTDRYHGGNPRFVNGVLGKWSSADLLAWFENLDVEFKEETKGKIFPVTEHASTIVDKLEEELSLNKIDVRLSTRVIFVNKEGNAFFVNTGLSSVLRAGKVIMATGGLTYPRLGASPDGYEIAKKFGHTIVNPLPCLTGFETHNKEFFDLQGVQTNAETTLIIDGRAIITVTDEVMFTHYGISGPAVFDISPYAVRTDLARSLVILQFNLFPGLDEKQVEEKIIRIWESNPARPIGISLIGLLPKKLAQVVMRNMEKMDLTVPCSNISRETRKSLSLALTRLEVRLKKPCDFKDAQVTAGGVNTDEVDPQTMASKKCPGLYFAGEILDIDGDCGGFNLQFAFSSGRQAGLSAAYSRPQMLFT